MTMTLLVFFVIAGLVPVMLGLFLVTLGIWELRAGVDRERFIKYFFSGLLLMIVVPACLAWIGMYAFQFVF